MFYEHDQNKVRIEIWVETREQAEQISEVLGDAEVEGELDFAYDFRIHEDFV